MLLRLSSSSRASAGAAAPVTAPLLRRARHTATAAAAAAAGSAPFRPADAAAFAGKRSQFAATAVSPSSSATSSSSSFDGSDPSTSSSPSSSPSSPPPRFKIHSIAGDGSCLFRALAQGAHYLDATSYSSSSSPSSKTKKTAAAAVAAATATTSNNGGFSLGALSPPPPPPPLLLEGPDLLAAGFAARRKICAALARNREEIEPFLETPFHAYLDAMSTEGTWGGEPELSVAPEALGRPVCVYSRARDVSSSKENGGGNSGSNRTDLASLFFGDDIVKVSEYGVGEEDFEGVAPICLLFGGLHYDLLIVEG